MISYTNLRTLFGQLSLNNNTANLDLGTSLMNIEHRYLLQKYFSNEGTFQISTVGSQTLTTTGSISASATSATLTTAWPYHTTTASVSFTPVSSSASGDTRTVQFTRGSTAITWAVGLSTASTTSLAVGGLQYYPAPPNYSKMKTVTITIGALQWTPTEVLARQEWDQLNVFPYYADIPDRYFIYPAGDQGVQVGIWPIPSTTGNTITYNYKFRIPDLSIIDYTTPGTISVSNGGTTITGAATTFVPTTNPQLESRWIQIPQPSGDNLWYQIDHIVSTTSAILYTPYQGIAVAGATTFTIGQMPLLMEDFHDLLLWKALAYYFTSVVDNKGKREQYQSYYDTKLELLSEYAGTKTVHVNLGRRLNILNPNLFPQNLS